MIQNAIKPLLKDLRRGKWRREGNGTTQGGGATKKKSRYCTSKNRPPLHKCRHQGMEIIVTEGVGVLEVLYAKETGEKEERGYIKRMHPLRRAVKHFDPDQ